MRRILGISVFLVLAAVLSACKQAELGPRDLTITVNADGVSRAYRYNKTGSVGQFLQEIGVVLGELDEVNPSVYTQLKDGMRITVARVTEEPFCEEKPLPYETTRQFIERLPPGEERVGQVGEEGQVQICYLITKKDGVEVSRNESSRVVIKAPRDEIVWVGIAPPDTLVPIEGILTYISGGQALIIQGNTTRLRALTSEGQLDGRVFDLSPDGRQLLYTRSTADENDPAFSNELWAILDTTADVPTPVQLEPEDVRVGQWVPGQETYTVSYSTANPTTDGVGWKAYNDLWLMQLDPNTGKIVGKPQEIVVPNNLGAYSYWGRRYRWSPDGTQVAWSLADSVGLVDQKTGEYKTLLSFKEYATLLARASVWVPALSWSADGRLITTVHGAPYGSEAPEDSIIFNTAVVDTVQGFQVNPFFTQSGIWSTPTYSPTVQDAAGNPVQSIAYFKAREPLNSLGAQYDLYLADSDGSNERLLFPGPDKPGFRSPDPEDGLAWSPQARQIAFIYQSNLWIYDFETGQPHQITSDGQASRPRWSATR